MTSPNNQLAEPVAERAEPPVIKRLEWREPCKATNGCWTAKSPLGTYSVVNEDGWYACRDDVPRDFYFEWSWRDMSRDNLLTAQAACQADFEARIRSALASPASISGEGSGAVTHDMVTAALAAWDNDWRNGPPEQNERSAMRAALTAALATAPEGKGGSNG